MDAAFKLGETPFSRSQAALKLGDAEFIVTLRHGISNCWLKTDRAYAWRSGRRSTRATLDEPSLRGPVPLCFYPARGSKTNGQLSHLTHKRNGLLRIFGIRMRPDEPDADHVVKRLLTGATRRAMDASPGI
jgi:hypothetical protein